MKRIFIVDDESTARFFLKEMIIHAGYEVAGEAASASEAFKKISHSKPDLILMDTQLEGELDGLSLTFQLEEVFSIPVIFVTAYQNQHFLKKMKQSSLFYGYIEKPVNQLELENMIYLALRRKEAEEESALRFAQIQKENHYHAILHDFLQKINRNLDPISDLQELLENFRFLFGFKGIVFYLLNQRVKIMEKERAVFDDSFSERPGSYPGISLSFFKNAQKTFSSSDLPEKIQQDLKIDENSFIGFFLKDEMKIVGMILIYGSENLLGEIAKEEPYFGYFLTMFTLLIKRHFQFEDVLMEGQIHLIQQELIQRYSRLGAMGKLIRALGHEIYQPLQSIKLLSDSVLFWEKKGKALERADLLENFQKISERVDFATSLMKQVRESLVKRQSLEMEKTNFELLIRKAVKEIEKEQEVKEIEIQIMAESDLPDFFLPRSQCVFMIQELICNASANLESLDREKKLIRIELYKKGRSVYVEVSDNGSGILESDENRIYDPLYSGDKKKVRMGMGLFIVNNLMLVLGGTLYHHGNEWGGTTFVLKFPIV